MNIKAATIQMTSTRDRTANLEKALGLVDRAASLGAQVAALPENWLHMRGPDDPVPAGVSLDGTELSAIGAAAARHGMYLLAGTVPEAIEGSGKVYNTSVFFGPDGKRLGMYRKIHLFDISLAGGETHRESDSVCPGTQTVTCDTSFGRAGLSVCYDLRFPELYRRMALDGASLFFVSAAFTMHTGKDHWTALLRARAIENLSFIVAAGQYGRNTENRVTYGRSVIIDPWGTILAQAPDGETVAVAELDFDHQKQIRSELPCLEHAQKWLFG